MAHALIIAGLIVLVVAILIKMFALILALAIPIGLVLLVVGAVWLIAERARGKR
jgi:hypothetical protein